VACKCAECYTLTEFLADNGLPMHELPHAPGHQRLRVLTMSPQPACNGSLTCPCPTCVQERLERQRKPQRIRQPWEARTAA